MKKIAIITATRAEYGLFKPILKAIASDPELEYHLIVTGTHLSEEFGNTISIIDSDDIRWHKHIPILNEEDTGASMAKYIGKLTTELAHEFEKSKPDILLLLGDRGEMLVGAIAASCMNIAIVHIHGGEESGSVDDHFRKSITKMAHMHLAATENSKKNLIALGEKPEHIVVVGAPGLDSITEGLLSPEETAQNFNLNLSKPVILMVQHSVTTEVGPAEKQIRQSLDVLAELGHQTILIYPNADPGGRAMIKVIEEYLAKYEFMQGYKSLRRKDYLSLLNVANVMVGNSSSGIIEAQSFHLPAVNIGTRQHGREHTVNVIDVPYDKATIKAAIEKALNDEEFNIKIIDSQNPYGDGNTTSRIITILKELKIDKEFLQKRSV